MVAAIAGLAPAVSEHGMIRRGQSACVACTCELKASYSPLNPLVQRFNLAFLYERGAGGLAQSQEKAMKLFDSAASSHSGASRAIADRLFR